MNSQDFFNKIFLHNAIKDHLIAIAIIVVGFLAMKIFRLVLSQRLAKNTSKASQYFLKVERLVYPALYVLIVYVALNYLTFPEKWNAFFNSSFSVAIVFMAVRIITGIVKIAIYSYVEQQHETGADRKLKQINGIVLVLNGALWILGGIFLFDNLGFNVTAVITGLGVGGIAIALAAQTILGDIFNYFVIFFDRPFELGDFIIVEDKMGTVEYIGLKTTRVRSLQGEQIIFSNSNLTNARINNYKSMKERRVVFILKIVYKTSHDVLAEIPSILRRTIEIENDTRFDRAHFAKFETFSLDFEIVYYILNADYNHYMDIQQRINLGICKEFDKKGIQFAIPQYHIRFDYMKTLNDGMNEKNNIINEHSLHN